MTSPRYCDKEGEECPFHYGRMCRGDNGPAVKIDQQDECPLAPITRAARLGEEEKHATS